MASSCLEIWATETEAPFGDQIVLWNGYEEQGGSTCLLKLIDDQADKYRTQYLRWISEIGNADVNGRRLIDWLEIDPGFSYWWMTRVAESNYLASRAFLDVMRLMALEDLLRKRQPNQVRLVGVEKRVSQAIAGLCKSLDIPFETECSPRSEYLARDRWTHRPSLRSVRALAVVVLWLIRMWPIRRGPIGSCLPSEDSVLLCTYNIAIPGEDNMEARAYGRYWGELPSLLASEGREVTWLHNLHASRQRTVSGVLEHLKSHGNGNKPNQSHAILQAWLSTGVIWVALTRWKKIVRAAVRIGDLQHYLDRSNRPWLWSLMADDWRESVFGVVAFSNLINLELFDRALSAIPRQSQGLLIYENQPWEQAFVHCWRKHGHGELIGVAHVMVRYWDIRYFCYRSPCNSRSSLRSTVDLIAVNGPSSLNTCLKAGLPLERIIEVEALRFNHLDSNSLAIDVDAITDVSPPVGGPLRLLVLGDSDQRTTLQMISVLREAVEEIDFDLEITFRAHPNFFIDPDEFPDLSIPNVRYSLKEERQMIDAVLSSNFTSASLERHLLGIPTLVMYDSMGLNFSPMLEVETSKFVRSAKDLVVELRILSGEVGTPVASRVSDYFWLDARLPRWCSALGFSK